MTEQNDTPAIAKHKHVFAALWWGLGPYGRQDVHIHSCTEGEPGDCARVVVGPDRKRCDGNMATHKRATLPLPDGFKLPGESA